MHWRHDSAQKNDFLYNSAKYEFSFYHSQVTDFIKCLGNNRCEHQVNIETGVVTASCSSFVYLLQTRLDLNCTAYFLIDIYIGIV
jgi:hypothetical protein